MFNLIKSIIPSLLAITTISYAIFIKPVAAGIFLSPMYLKMESQQGQSKGVLQVGNTGSKPIRVRLSVTAFTYNKDGAFQRRDRYQNKSPNQDFDDDLTPYLRYSPQELLIPGNSSRRVRLISLLPPSLPEGEYRTAIFAETLQERTNSEGLKVGFNMSIGSALYVAKGETEPNIVVVAGNLEQQRQLKLLIANQGSATAKGKINWTLKQGKKVVASGESGGSFLPNSQTNLVLNRQQQLDIAPGDYQLSGEIIWEKVDKQQVSNFDFEIKL